MPGFQTYARALRAGAIVLAVGAVGRELAAGTHPDDVRNPLAAIRLSAAAVAVLVAVLAAPTREIPAIRRLAFILALTALMAALGVIVVTPGAVPEQTAIIGAVLIGSALFIPWSWRWQAALAAVMVAGTTVVLFALGSATGVTTVTLVRLCFTLALVGAASTVGAGLRDAERLRAAAAEAERREHDRRQVQQQRLDALARLAGGFAHQFNNLLGGILTHAAVLRESAARGEGNEALDQVLAAARRGRDLTRELLRFTRNAPLTLRPTAVAEVVRGVVTVARTTLPDSTPVDVNVAADLPAMTADPDHLVQACVELVLNARDAMRGASRARLTVAAAVETVREGDTAWRDATPGRYVRLSLSDTGAGMDAATLERVFEPFFTTKPLHQAAGIGLAQVYQTVRDHNGVVRIDSEPRRGTTVHILIPAATERAPAPAPISAAAAPPVTARAAGTILVVDDEAIVRSSLQRALTRLGYRVIEAGDGGSALAALQGADPPVDLVILDLVLPGGGAGIFEVLKAVRPEIRVLLSTGYSPDAANARALAARADGFLPKPYEMAELKQAVARALGRG